MASSPTPPALDELGARRFSFYPPIVNIEHNEWEVVRGAWSEILVHNPKMGMEIWIPRAWLGEISKIEEPVMIVGLKREIEYGGGTVFPHTRRVLSMPKVNLAAPAPANPRSTGGISARARAPAPARRNSPRTGSELPTIWDR